MSEGQEDVRHHRHSVNGLTGQARQMGEHHRRKGQKNQSCCRQYAENGGRFRRKGSMHILRTCYGRSRSRQAGSPQDIAAVPVVLGPASFRFSAMELLLFLPLAWKKPFVVTQACRTSSSNVEQSMAKTYFHPRAREGSEPVAAAEKLPEL
jgi:hypothetical protein